MNEEQQAAYDAALKAAEEATAKVAEAESQKSGLVEELKDIRTQKQDLQTKLDETKPKEGEGEKDPVDAEAAVEAVLARRSEQTAKDNLAKAQLEFKASNHEFSEAADPGGIKYAAFERELAKFSLGGLNSVDEFTERFKDAKAFMERGSNPQPASVNNYRGASKGSGSEAPEGEYSLDSREEALLKQTGWTKERYLALKEKQPSYVEQTLNQIV